MNAAIDLGNTFAKIGYFEKETLIEARYKIPLEELAEVLTQQLPEQAILSSTSQDTQPYADLLQKRGVRVVQLLPSLPLPIGKEYDTPQTLGADRLAAAAGETVVPPRGTAPLMRPGVRVAVAASISSAAVPWSVAAMAPFKRCAT